MKYTWLVEKYLEGELTGTELSEFELKILKDPSVAEELERIRELHDFSREQHSKSREQHSKFKETIELIEDFDDSVNILTTDEIQLNLDELMVRRISNSYDSDDLVRKIRKAYLSDASDKRSARLLSLVKYNIWLSAASFALILAVSVLLLTRLSPDADYLTIYSEYYQPYYPELTMRDTDDGMTDDFKTGLNEYMKANYSSALEFFNNSISDDPVNQSVFLFMGITLMEVGDFEQALVALSKLNSDRLLDEYGLWYSGLCHLRLNNFEEARSNFNSLIKGKSYYAPQARSILRQI